jgi:aminoglycoside phosphotransferase (APT) family kinase protein
MCRNIGHEIEEINIKIDFVDFAWSLAERPDSLRRGIEPSNRPGPNGFVLATPRERTPLPCAPMAAHEPVADIRVDANLVRALLREQCPELAELPLLEVANGWDNAIFRLGDALAVRVPRRRVAAGLIEHEQRWLPALAPSLPLPVPVPVACGRASDRFPFPWSVCRWFEDRSSFDAPPSDLVRAAEELGAFVKALHVPAPADAPINPFRGIDLGERASRFEDSLPKAAARRSLDASAAMATWQSALAAPRWDGPPLWLHGDLHPANVLTHDGRLAAIIDFGDICAGDPATDLAIAWMLFDARSRERFRAAVACDDATWLRAMGWATALAVAYVAHSPEGSPMIPIGVRTLENLRASS